MQFKLWSQEIYLQGASNWFKYCFENALRRKIILDEGDAAAAKVLLHRAVQEKAGAAAIAGQSAKRRVETVACSGAEAKAQAAQMIHQKDADSEVNALADEKTAVDAKATTADKDSAEPIRVVAEANAVVDSSAFNDVGFVMPKGPPSIVCRRSNIEIDEKGQYVERLWVSLRGENWFQLFPIQVEHFVSFSLNDQDKQKQFYFRVKKIETDSMPVTVRLQLEHLEGFAPPLSPGIAQNLQNVTLVRHPILYFDVKFKKERDPKKPNPVLKMFLEWDIISKPKVTQVAEQVLAPVLGKSYVVYSMKPVNNAK
jgi:hypothetical protein